MELSFIRVRTYEQAMQLRNVRNECREGMTHDTSIITREQQDRFYFKELLPATTYEAHMLLDGDQPIGYGLLKWDGDKYWMTAGLVEAVRGKGLSRLIINFITEMGHREGKEVWIDVYDDNLALFGDIRVGYQFVNSDDYGGKLLHLMRHERERILRPEEAMWMRQKGHPKEPAPTPLSSVAQEMIEVDAISRDSYEEDARQLLGTARVEGEYL
jgi:hypothetical protein